MADLLPFLVIGLTVGSVYALAAVGLSLTFKTSGIFNFGYGAMGAVAVYVYYVLANRFGLPWMAAVAVAVLVVAPVMGLAFELLARRIMARPTEIRVMATIGIVLFVQGAQSLWGGYAFGTGRRRTGMLPGHLVRVLGVNIGVDQIIIMAVGVVATLSLYMFLQRTSLGTALRAVVDDPELLEMTGRSQRRVLRTAWALGIFFVALSALALVLSPSYEVGPDTLTLLVIQAFGAAAIGRFASLPLSYVGGLAVGLAGALATKWVAAIPSLGGVPTSIPFLVLVLVLVLSPGGLNAERRVALVRGWHSVRSRGRHWDRAGWGLALVASILVLTTAGFRLRYDINEAIGYAIILLSLGLVVRTSGQVSLCHIGLAAVGASSFGHFSSAHVPWLPAVLLAGLVTVPVGAVVAIPAIRVSGIYLAVATFGFGVLIQQLLYPTALMFNFQPYGAVLELSRPNLGPLHGANDRIFFVVLAAFLLASYLMVRGLERSRLGRLLRALGGSPVVLETSGASANVTRATVFCISAFLAGVGGALVIDQYQFLTSDRFDFTVSLTLLGLLLLFRLDEPWASIGAAGALVVAPSFLFGTAGAAWVDVLTGVGAVAVAAAGPAGSTGARRRLGARLHLAAPATAQSDPRPAPATSFPRPSVPDATARSPRPAPAPTDLRVAGLVVRYGGLVAVDDVSLTARGGIITGLIGPNGAGKTTLFDACCGLVRPAAGAVLLGGNELSGRSPAARARLGLGRTFQRLHLLEPLSVLDNVAIGAEAARGGASPVRQVLSRRRDLADVLDAAQASLREVGMQHAAATPVAVLSTGERRLVELARVLSGSFSFLLLDEPSSGLDQAETAMFGQVLVRVAAERGLGVLLVEHDLSLVMGVCAEVHMLDFGRLVFSGTPDEATSDPTVRAAYIGA